MADNQIDIGFSVANDELDAALSQATDQIEGAMASIDASLGGLGESARGATQALKTLAEEPGSSKAIEDQFAAEASQVQELKVLRQISADDAIQQQIRIENAKYASLRAQLEDTYRCLTEEEAMRENIQAKADALELKHNAKLRQLDLQAAKDSEQAWTQTLAPIGSAFRSTLSGIITGHETLRQATARLAQQIIIQFADMAIKRATNWAASELAMTEATATGNAARTASDAAAATASSGFSFAKALDEIGANAARVYSSVFAWASPALGPFAAIPAAAASALVIAKEALVPSAAGGFDIPAGLNPLTQLHEQEMVLPASIANPLRANLAGGGVNNGSATTNNYHFSPTVNVSGGGAPQKIADTTVAALRNAARTGAFGSMVRI
jgi:hypothetical protein